MTLVSVSQQQQRQQQQHQESSSQVAVQMQQQHEVVVEAQGVSVSVFQSFPSRLLYVLDCIKNTTLGPEIVKASLPWPHAVVPAAERFDKIGRFMWRVLQVSVPAVCVLHFLAALETVSPDAHKWVTILAGVSGAAYGLPLVGLFGICIYSPLLWIILPVALVLQVDNAGTARNDFLKVSVSQQSTAVGIANLNLEQHVFAAQLREEEEVTVMVYEEAWVSDNFSARRFFNEVGVCAFLVWELVILGSLGEIYPGAGITAVWIIVRLGLCLVLPRVLLRVACIGGAIVWGILNIVFCCVPTLLVEMGQKHVHDAVLSRACSRAVPPSSQDGVQQDGSPSATGDGMDDTRAVPTTNLEPQPIGAQSPPKEIEDLEASNTVQALNGDADAESAIVTV